MSLWLLDSLLTEAEEKFLADRNLVAFSSPLADLTAITSEFELRRLMQREFPDETPERIAIDSGRLWQFVERVMPEDIVVVICDSGGGVRLAEIYGAYFYDAAAPETLRHLKPVKWLTAANGRETPLPLAQLLPDYTPPQRPRITEITDEKLKDRILSPIGLSRSFTLRYIPLAVAGVLGARIIYMLIDNIIASGIF